MRLKSGVVAAWPMCLESSLSDMSEQPTGQTSPHQVSQLYDIKKGQQKGRSETEGVQLQKGF